MTVYRIVHGFDMYSLGAKIYHNRDHYTGTDVIQLLDKSEGAKFTQSYNYDLHLIEWYMCQRSKVLINVKLKMIPVQVREWPTMYTKL